MKLHLADKEIDVPDKLYLDQLIQLDLKALEAMDFDKKDENGNERELTPEESLSIIPTILNFLKVLGVKERLTVNDLMAMKDDLRVWIENLMSGFQTSN